MNHNEFVQTLKAGKVSGAYLFEGVEENIKSVTLAALRKAVLADGLAELNESVMENPSAGEIIAACETLPFASDKRLVVVRELNGTTGRSEAEERLVSYIPKVPDSCVLVIYVRGKADGRKKLYSAVKKKGGIVSFEPLGDAELNGWIVRVFQQNGKKCAPDVASLLSFTVGNDTALLRAEIEKLTALAGDRDTITEIISVADNTRGIGYEIELIRKDLIAMAAQAEARRDYLPSVIGDVEVFKRNLLASMPRPKLADYMADSLVWLCTFALVSTATYTVMGRPWDCHYDAVWLVLCIAIMMPSAWLLQRIVPAEWAASTEKGVRYGAITAAMLFLWFVEFWFVDKWITPLLPAVGLPNLAAVILFGAAMAALLIWRNHRRNELAEKRPWRDVMEK